MSNDVFMEISGITITEEEAEELLDRYYKNIAKEMKDYIDSGDWFMDSDRRKDDGNTNT